SPALGPIEQSHEWAALREHQRGLREQRIADLFHQDPRRFERYSLEAAGLLLDYSKQLLTDETLDKLIMLARQRRLEPAIGALFAGQPVNSSEGRPALHTALRSPRRDTPQERLVHETLAGMEAFVRAVQEGEWTGYT